MMAPMVHGLEADYAGRILFTYLDADDARTDGFQPTSSARVQACYRGPRLYDTEATRAVVRKWVGFYRAHRAILDSDVVHLRRPDGRDWDGLLHVSPDQPTRGLAVIHNPLDVNIEREIRLPLYHTGPTEAALVRGEDGTVRRTPLGRDHGINTRVTVPTSGPHLAHHRGAMSLLLFLATLPSLYWAQPVETAPALKQAGIERLCVPTEAAAAWTAAGFTVVPLGEKERKERTKLQVPGLRSRAEVASASVRTPWIFANGWRYLRKPDGRYWGDVPAGP